MEYEVIHSGANRPGKDGKPNQRIPIGERIEVEGKLPGYLVGKVRPVGDGGEPVAVTNPAEGGVVDTASAQERQTLMGEAAKLLDDDDFTKGGEPKVDALNACITDDSVPRFTAEERAALWPGIKDAVEAARKA